MLATRVLVRPCRPRWNPSSSGRSTRTRLSSTTTRMSGCIACCRLPRGPFTVTTLSSPTATSTPAGIVTGCFPIRLISPSPHVREDLAADTGARGLLVRQDALRRRHDRDAEPAHHAGELVAAPIDPAPGLRYPTEPGDRPGAARPVLQPDPERLVDALALAGKAADAPVAVGDRPE